MNLIDRYVTRGVLLATAYAVGVLTMVLVFGNIFKEAMDLLINRNVPLGYLLFFMSCVLAFSLTFTVPWGLLTAVLLVFGRMSADNETVALRACGISLLRASVPVLAISCLLGLFCLWINVAVAPHAETAMRNSLASMARSNPSALFVPGEVLDSIKGRKIVVGSKSGNEFRDVLVVEEDDQGQARAVVRARRGAISSLPESNELLFSLREATMEKRRRQNLQDFRAITHGIRAEEISVRIPLDAFVSSDLLWRPLRTRSTSELFGLLSQDLEKQEWPTRTAVRTEISKRFSLSFASVAFAVVAIPLGIVAQRRETSAGFAISIAVAFGYFFFVALSHSMSDNPSAYPYLLVWIPNVLFAAAGACLLARLDFR